jgi:hypothetical protein
MFSCFFFLFFEETSCVVEAETSDSFEILEANTDETLGILT